MGEKGGGEKEEREEKDERVRRRIGINRGEGGDRAL